MDGAAKGTVSAATPARQSQHPLYTITGLPPGPHTLTLTKQSGTYFLVDAFTLH